MDFHRRTQGPIAAGPQHGRLVIGNLRFLFPHGMGKHLIHRLKHVGIRAEILLQQNLAAGRVRGKGICLILAQKQGGIRQPEAINALLHIADHEQQVLLPLMQGLQNGLLNAGHILILIDKQRVKVPGHLGAYVRMGQGLEGEMLQIAVIQIVFLLLEGKIAPMQPPGQGTQGAQGRKGVAQVLPGLVRILRQQRPGGGDPLFPFLPQGLVFLRRLRAFLRRGAFGAQPGEGGFAPCQLPGPGQGKQAVGERLVRIEGGGVAGGAVPLMQQLFHGRKQLLGPGQLILAQLLQQGKPCIQLIRPLALGLRIAPGIRLGQQKII